MRKSDFDQVADVPVKTKRRRKRASPPSYPKYRQGKKAVIFYAMPELSDELRRLAIDNQTTLQDLLIEASNDMLRKHGRHPV